MFGFILICVNATLEKGTSKAPTYFTKDFSIIIQF